jgi:hypothetical protein
MIVFTESTFERAALAWLSANSGQVVHGPDIVWDMSLAEWVVEASGRALKRGKHEFTNDRPANLHSAARRTNFRCIASAPSDTGLACKVLGVGSNDLKCAPALKSNPADAGGS